MLRHYPAFTLPILLYSGTFKKRKRPPQIFEPVSPLWVKIQIKRRSLKRKMHDPVLAIKSASIFSTVPSGLCECRATVCASISAPSLESPQHLVVHIYLATFYLVGLYLGQVHNRFLA